MAKENMDAIVIIRSGTAPEKWLDWIANSFWIVIAPYVSGSLLCPTLVFHASIILYQKPMYISNETKKASYNLGDFWTFDQFGWNIFLFRLT